MSTGKPPYCIGWIVDSAPERVFSFPWQKLGPVSSIRYGNVARYLNRTDNTFRMERYLPWATYDAIVLVKKLNEPCLTLVRKLKASGTQILFDSNVNYYEEWGEFTIPGTRPRSDQMSLARDMTTLADVVVADSSYLAGLCQKLNPTTVMIPDAVDTDLFSPGPAQTYSGPRLRLIWSGISKKAHHLHMIEKVLLDMRDRLDLHLVINKPHPKDPPSPVIERLKQGMNARVSTFDYRRYVEDLRQADVIISPKILSSSYEMAHTEYKITTGMAVGLPALASAQGAYEEAIGANEGGWICRNESEWKNRFDFLQSNREAITQKGLVARQRVLDRYSVPVVAKQYKEALLLALKKTAAV